MAYRVQGLDPRPFVPLYGLADDRLAAARARRCRVDAAPGYPDRIALRDLAIGETAILLNYEHQPADTPYRARHAIFVREGAMVAAELVDTLPGCLRIRPISLRAFDADGEMVDADLADGRDLDPLIARFLADPAVACLHAHYAKRGCYAARIVRG